MQVAEVLSDLTSLRVCVRTSKYSSNFLRKAETLTTN